MTQIRYIITNLFKEKCVKSAVHGIKGALSNFCQTMWIFESTKTSPIPQQDLAPILKYPPHTYVHKNGSNDCRNKWRWHTSILKLKPNKDRLCEIKQNQRYSPIKKKLHNLGVRFQAFPLLEFSPPLESCSDIYAGPTACLIVSLLVNVLYLWYFPIFVSAISLYL